MFCLYKSKGPRGTYKLLREFKNVLVLEEGMCGGTTSFISKIISDHNINIGFKYNSHPNNFLKCGSMNSCLNNELDLKYFFKDKEYLNN